MPALPLTRTARRLGAGLLDLVLPVECAACRRPGIAWCVRCDRSLTRLALDPTAPVRPDPCPPGLPDVHAWGRYEGPLRAVVRAYKDGGRRDLAPLLGELLASSLSAAVHAGGWSVEGAILVPVPSSRRALRARGDIPLEAVARRAAGVLRAPERAVATRVLVHSRDVADQAGLGRGRRASNLAGALVVPSERLAVVRGRRVIVLDDVMTTGSTLAEAARALRAAGAGAIVAATVAATARKEPVGTSRPYGQGRAWAPGSDPSRAG